MKIQTTTLGHYGQRVKFTGGITVTFDEKGIVEVPQDVGEFLVGRYDNLFPEGQVPKPKPPAAKPSGKDSAEVEDLKERLMHANRVAAEANQSVKSAQDGERAWREKCEELLKDNEALKRENDVIASEATGLKKENDKLILKITELSGPATDDAQETTTTEDNNVTGEGTTDDKTQDDETPDDEATLRNQLNGKFLKELIAMAETLELPVAEYEKYRRSKQRMIDYLIEKTAKTDGQ